MDGLAGDLLWTTEVSMDIPEYYPAVTCAGTEFGGIDFSYPAIKIQFIVVCCQQATVE